jgi:hypothetical protein
MYRVLSPTANARADMTEYLKAFSRPAGGYVVADTAAAQSAVPQDKTSCSQEEGEILILEMPPADLKNDNIQILLTSNCRRVFVGGLRIR